MKGTLKDRVLATTGDYLIFFDNVRVDQFVESFSSQVSVDGGIGSASITMISLPDLFAERSSSEDIKVGSQEISGSYEVGRGIENMTNVRIFVKNVFTDKYRCVFDGNIRAKSISGKGSGKKITFSASDYMLWFTKTIAPLAIPLEDKLNLADRLRWKAQGIDINKVKTVNQVREINFRGKTIEQAWKEISEQTMKANKIYSESDVAKWDRPLDRVAHMADIDPKYTKEQSAMDFIVTTSATSLNSIYVTMNNLVKTMLLEFFQTPNGVVSIKSPFWGEPILKSHVIDSSLILDYSESINWDSEYSRVIASGGMEWWEDYETKVQDSLMPSVVYRGDGTTSTTATQEAGEGKGDSTPADSSGGKTGTWLDAYPITSGYGPRSGPTSGKPEFHAGADWAIPQGTTLKHVGGTGTVTGVGHLGNYGQRVAVTLDEGDYKGFFMTYAHLSSVSVKKDDKVSYGTVLGRTGGAKGTPGAGNSTGAHLHLDIKTGNNKNYNILDYLSASSGYGTELSYDIPVGNDELLNPTDYEKKYGPAIFNVSQPLIKFSTAGAVATNRSPMYDVLKDYAKFMFEYLNSAVNIASMQVVAMPWLKPGFNIWVDPTGENKIYYMNNISYQGSAQGGVYMSLGLTMGRTVDAFVNKKASVGSLNPGKSGNIFISKLNKGYITADGDFGDIVGKSAKEYEDFRTMMLKFHMGVETSEASFINGASSKFYTSLYGESATEEAPSEERAEVINVSSTTTSSSFDVSKWRAFLRMGSVGTDVREMQTILKNSGFTEVGEIDGSFGPKTQTAVKNFQAKYAPPVDGVVGPITKAALNNMQQKTYTV